MSRYLRWSAVVSLVVGCLSLTAYGANKSAPQDDSADSAKISSQMGQASFLGTARQVVLSEVPLVAPYHGKPRPIPDQKEPIESDEVHPTGLPIPGYQAGPPSALPSHELPPDGHLEVTFGGGSESSCGFWIPSDHAMAFSDTGDVLQVLNACIYVFSSTGSVLSGPLDLATFFGATGDAVGDPRALYDWRNKRFIIVAEDFTANNILVAASKTSNPTGSWWTYTLSANSGGLTGTADFPMIGQTMWEAGNSNYGGLYVSWDRFGSSGFMDNVVWILPKDKIYSGAGFSWHYFYNLNYGGHTVDHVQPADVMSKGAAPRAEMLMNTLDFNYGCNSGTPCNGLIVWAIYWGIPPAGQAPTLSGKFINTANNYIYPVTAAQPGSASGSSCAVNTGNAGFTAQIYWAAGDLYGAASTGALNGQASDGWIYWQVHPALSDAVPSTITGATIRNEVCWGCNGFTGDSTFSEYYPAVLPDEDGNINVVFNASSSSVYPSTVYLMNRQTHASGGFYDGGVYLATGQAAYCQLDSIGRNRWGDYTGTSQFGVGYQLRPTFWFGGQYSDSSGNWATQLGQSNYSNVAQP